MLDENEIELYFEKKLSMPQNETRLGTQGTKHIVPGAVGQVHWCGYSEPGRFRIWEIEGNIRI